MSQILETYQSIGAPAVDKDENVREDLDAEFSYQKRGRGDARA